MLDLFPLHVAAEKDVDIDGYPSEKEEPEHEYSLAVEFEALLKVERNEEGHNSRQHHNRF